MEYFRFIVRGVFVKCLYGKQTILFIYLSFFDTDQILTILVYFNYFS